LNKTLLCIYCVFMVVVFVTSVVDWWHLRKTGVFFYFVLFLVLGAVVLVPVSYAMTRNLVDEVFDDGDSLLVRFRGEEERIPFSNIDDVTAWNARPARITLPQPNHSLNRTARRRRLGAVRSQLVSLVR
jgi:hypothetical protein